MATVGCWTAVQLAPPSHLIVINESRSLPRGLYRLSAAPIQRGAIVAIVPPPAARAYLQSLGAPEDARLLKRIAGAGGDLVCMRQSGLATPAGELSVAVRDRMGRLLPSWRGCRRLEPEELLVLGDSHDSFDSRYFGPVRRSETTGPYVEAIHW